MEDSLTNSQSPDLGMLELGQLLGGRRAFGTISGRCSAADAACLRGIRDKKLYERMAASWDEFCPKYLGMSKRSANRVIHYLEEFGPDYFELAQLTRITPEQYRAIAPAVKDKAVHWNGDAIALIPENSEKIAAAVEELHRTAGPSSKPPRPRKERMAAWMRRARELKAEFADLADTSGSHQERMSLWDLRKEMIDALNEVDVLSC